MTPQKLSEQSIIKYQPHNCRIHDKLIKCSKGIDTWKCKICGREIEEPCNFDDDYN